MNHRQLNSKEQRDYLLNKRKSLGMTQRQMAEQLNISRKEYAWYEWGGQGEYPGDTTVKISKADQIEHNRIMSQPGVKDVDGVERFNPEQAEYIRRLLAEMKHSE